MQSPIVINWYEKFYLIICMEFGTGLVAKSNLSD